MLLKVMKLKNKHIYFHAVALTLSRRQLWPLLHTAVFAGTLSLYGVQICTGIYTVYETVSQAAIIISANENELK